MKLLLTYKELDLAHTTEHCALWPVEHSKSIGPNAE